MARRFVDLSIFLDNDTLADPPFMRPNITDQTHSETVAEVRVSFPAVTAADFPGGQAFAASESRTLTTHNGTRTDARRTLTRR